MMTFCVRPVVGSNVAGPDLAISCLTLSICWSTAVIWSLMAWAFPRQYASPLSEEDAGAFPWRPAPEFPFASERPSDDRLPTTEIPPPKLDKSSLVYTRLDFGLSFLAFAWRDASAGDCCLFPESFCGAATACDSGCESFCDWAWEDA